MAVPGQVRMHQEEGRVTFLVEGQGTMHLSPALRRHAESQLTSGARWLGIDLRGCTYLDSTFLGTLVVLKQSARSQAPCCEFVLVSPSPECQQLLKQMRLAKHFPTVDARALPMCDCVDLSPDSRDVVTFQQNIVQAHQQLAELSGLAGDPFRAVAARMSQEANSGPQT